MPLSGYRRPVGAIQKREKVLKGWIKAGFLCILKPTQLPQAANTSSYIRQYRLRIKKWVFVHNISKVPEPKKKVEYGRQKSSDPRCWRLDSIVGVDPILYFDIPAALGSTFIIPVWVDLAWTF